jgi:flavin-dependent dehydrogenase
LPGNVKRFDVLVIGGGPAGATAAALLARAGWSVAVAEKSIFPRDKVCGGFLAATSTPLLEELGLSEAFARSAGPEIRTVGLFAGASQLAADMPSASPPCCPFGRAMPRENFDAMLLARAAHHGATIYQPWSIVGLEKDYSGFRCLARRANREQTTELRARLVIAAHGSWMPGPLATQARHGAARSSDLIGFKAHFHDAALPSHFMPLVAFPGGYGGMVNAGDRRSTFSFCVRRDVLESCRKRKPRAPAGEALLAYIANASSGLRHALQDAARDGPWLAAGPIRPGVRQFFSNEVFVIGNAAGEAHPAIAEGIGMAMQSAAILCRTLLERPEAISMARAAREASIAYEKRWRSHFGARVAASKLIAQVAMRPRAIALSERLMRRAPSLLSFCARLSGKAH